MAKKSVRFCAFDLSTVDMPSDAVQGSSLPGKVAQFRRLRFTQWHLALLSSMPRTYVLVVMLACRVCMRFGPPI